jgi:hypothetical protein
VYALFDVLADKNLPTNAYDALCHNLSDLTDRVLEAGLGKREVGNAVEILRGLSAMELVETVNGWRNACIAANSPAELEILLRDYLGWIANGDNLGRSALRNYLPRLCPCLKELQAATVPRFMRLARSVPENECESVLRIIASYGVADARAVEAILSIASDAVALQRTPYLEGIHQALHPGHVLQDSDSRRFLPALAILSKQLRKRGVEEWALGMDIVSAIAKSNISSAYVVADELPACVAQMGPGQGKAYLEGFLLLGEQLGIRIVGFGLGPLARIYRDHEVARARQFVGFAAQIAELCGLTAAEWFLERKTNAGREALDAKSTSQSHRS